MNSPVCLDDRLSVRDGVDLREVEGIPVLFSIETGKYFGLEGVGVDIWREIDEGLTLREVAEKLVQDFDVPLPVCQKDVIRFAENLLESALVDIVQNQS